MQTTLGVYVPFIYIGTPPAMLSIVSPREPHNITLVVAIERYVRQKRRKKQQRHDGAEYNAAGGRGREVENEALSRRRGLISVAARTE